MVQYLHFRILKFPLITVAQIVTICHKWSQYVIINHNIICPYLSTIVYAALRRQDPLEELGVRLLIFCLLSVFCNLMLWFALVSSCMLHAIFLRWNRPILEVLCLMTRFRWEVDGSWRFIARNQATIWINMLQNTVSGCSALLRHTCNSKTKCARSSQRTVAWCGVTI